MDTPNRNFYTAKDFAYADEDGNNILEENPLRDAIWGILMDIINPIFESVFTDIGNVVVAPEEITNGVGNVVVFSVGRSCILTDDKRASDFVRLFEEYADGLGQILSDVKRAMNPTVKADLMEKYGLSGEQFIIRLVNVKVGLKNKCMFNRGEKCNLDYGGAMRFGVIVHFHLLIEDVSAYGPEGIEAQRLRYNNLCITEARYPESEVRDWARSLGISDADVMTKPELCAAVRNHYDF